MEREGSGPELVMDRELEQKLSDMYILVSDMEKVVEYCEKEQAGAVSSDGHVTGHLKIGYMTYWAEYEALPDGRFRLWNGYAHRMNLEGE